MRVTEIHHGFLEIKMAAFLLRLIIAAGCLITAPLMAQTIAVEGRGFVAVTPEFATLSGAVSHVSPATAASAQNRVDQALGQLLAAMEKLPIDRNTVDAGRLRIEPRYRWNRSSETQQLIGYEAIRAFSFRLIDLDKVGEALQALSEAGATRLDAPIYGSSEVLSARSAALEQAYANAFEDAKTLALASGLTLGTPKTMSTGLRAAPIFRATSRATPEALSADQPPRYEPGQLQVTASVSVVFNTGP